MPARRSGGFLLTSYARRGRVRCGAVGLAKVALPLAPWLRLRRVHTRAGRHGAAVRSPWRWDSRCSSSATCAGGAPSPAVLELAPGTRVGVGTGPGSGRVEVGADAALGKGADRADAAIVLVRRGRPRDELVHAPLESRRLQLVDDAWRAARSSRAACFAVVRGRRRARAAPRGRRWAGRRLGAHRLRQRAAQRVALGAQRLELGQQARSLLAGLGGVHLARSRESSWSSSETSRSATRAALPRLVLGLEGVGDRLERSCERLSRESARRWRRAGPGTLALSRLDLPGDLVQGPPAARRGRRGRWRPWRPPPSPSARSCGSEAAWAAGAARAQGRWRGRAACLTV